MPPLRLRLRLRPSSLCACIHRPHPLSHVQRRSASAAAAPIESTIQQYPPTQPPSHKRPEFRKTQLHRQYTSLIRSSPLILVFQHNNLTSPEWMGIRRELVMALRKVDDELAERHPERPRQWLADSIKIQVIQAGIFAAALKIVEFFDPVADSYTPPPPPPSHPTDPSITSSAEMPNTTASPDDPSLRHALSRTAYLAARRDKNFRHGLETILSGPLAVVAFPSLSPQHLAAVLRTLSPDRQFAAPKRAASPSYHEPDVQFGLQKLMLLGARVEGKACSDAELRWIGGMEGGIDGLRAQLVAMLQSLGASVAGALEGAGRSLYFTLEGRKMMLEEEKEKERGGEKKEQVS